LDLNNILILKLLWFQIGFRHKIVGSDLDLKKRNPFITAEKLTLDPGPVLQTILAPAPYKGLKKTQNLGKVDCSTLDQWSPLCTLEVRTRDGAGH